MGLISLVRDSFRAGDTGPIGLAGGLLAAGAINIALERRIDRSRPDAKSQEANLMACQFGAAVGAFALGFAIVGHGPFQAYTNPGELLAGGVFGTAIASLGVGVLTN